MAGMFDDLIPAGAQSEARGMFDDLVPRRQTSAPGINTPAGFDAAFAGLENPQVSPELRARMENMQDLATRQDIAPERALEVDRYANRVGGAGLGNVALQGLTFGLSDEALAALASARGEADYDTALAGEREALERIRKERPMMSLATEVAGSLPTVLLPFGMAARGASLGQKAVQAGKAGATYGALYGAGSGEGAADRAVGAGSGAILGGLFGAGTPYAVAGAGAVGRAVNEATGNIPALVRGAINPDKEASRIVASGLQAGSPKTADIPAAAEAVMRGAQANGQPLAVGDLGGERLRGIARSAANVSPEAREALTELTMGRAREPQAIRLNDFVSQLMGGVPDADARRAALQAAARQENEKNYRTAYQAGQAVWNDALQSRLESDAFRSAVKDATRIGTDVAAAKGERAVRSPFTVGEDGTLTLRKNPDGSTAIPNLEFWDKVKQGLDSKIGVAVRAGDKPEVARLTELKNAFIADLDAAVPQYKAARSGAASFFGADDALQAGQNFVSQKLDLGGTKRAIAKMSPAERELFAEGYANNVVERIQSIADNRNVAIDALFNNPLARQKLDLAMGPQRARALEAYIRVENIMDLLKRAVTGNSTTARQLIEAGLSQSAPAALGAGATALGSGSYDWKTLGLGAVAGAVTRKGAGVVNERIARRVGEMLASTDPNVVRKAFETIGRTPNARARIIDLERVLSREAGLSGGSVPVPQMAVSPKAAAENEDNP